MAATGQILMSLDTDVEPGDGHRGQHIAQHIDQCRSSGPPHQLSLDFRVRQLPMPSAPFGHSAIRPIIGQLSDSICNLASGFVDKLPPLEVIPARRQP